MILIPSTIEEICTDYKIPTRLLENFILFSCVLKFLIIESIESIGLSRHEIN